MILAIALGIVLVALTVLVHYEALRLAAAMLPRLTAIQPRARMVFVILAAFAAHTVEVYLYAFGFWFLDDFAEAGKLMFQNGQPADDLATLIYFSTVSYTSLGFGDVYPLGGLRLVSGIEALNGLLLIGWSASFTYLCMEKLWPLHIRGGERKHWREHW